MRIRLLFVALLAVLPLTSAWSQALTPVEAFDSPPIIDATGVLIAQPASQAVLAQFQAQRATLNAAPAVPQITYQLNETRVFKVRDLDTQNIYRTDNINFTLKAEGTRFRLWIETAELTNGIVLDNEVEQIRATLEEQLPSGSINPTLGLIESMEEVFGLPPRAASDKADVLVLDIRDGRAPGEGFVAGFVDPEDAPGGRGNNRDVLYLDTQPAVISDDGTRRSLTGLLATAAHEYQHLIRLAYDRAELTFVDEGLSEWSEVLHGFPGRTITYLGNPAPGANVPLLRWSGNSNANVFADYQRAGLFTTYLAERLGPDRTGLLTRDTRVGTSSYNAVLGQQNLTLGDVLLDFHTANYVNGLSADPRFSYSTPQRATFRAAARRVADGRAEASTPRQSLVVLAGGASYLSWVNVTDFTYITRSTTPGGEANIRVRLVLTRDGITTVQDGVLGPNGQTLSGSYDEVTLILAHQNPDATPISLLYEASWTSEGSFTLAPVSYDDGILVTPSSFGLTQGANVGYATRFEVPASGRLGTVRLPLYFFSQFGGGPAETAERSFDLVVWDEAADGGPGAELLRTRVTDTRGYQPVLTTDTQVRFFEADISDEAANVNLPATIYLGAVNEAGDTNGLVYPMASYTPENRSYLFVSSQNAWRPMWSLNLGDNSLTNRIVPVRADFLVATNVSNTPTLDVPTEVVLRAAYPNPFNPSTTLSFDLPASAPVRLAVYDLLGREVAVLVDGVRAAGTHTVTVDAAAWTSGLYLYRLSTAGQVRTGTMSLVK
ncbi:MAG: T9SS type A sorting domain-containing protein [Bacteroidota bacterium]